LVVPVLPLMKKGLKLGEKSMLCFNSVPTGHDPVIRPPSELISLPPHLLVKGSEQDIAQQRRDDPALWSSPWGFMPAALLLVARRERVLNKLQHPAIGDLLPDQSHELFVCEFRRIPARDSDLMSAT